MTNTQGFVLAAPNRKQLCRLTLLSMISLAVGVATYGRADSIVLWNKLGSASEVTNSTYGPDLQFYSGGGGVDVPANPAFVPGVFGNALSIGAGSYSTFDRVHNAVVPNLDQLVSPQCGTIEAWYRETSSPVANAHDIYRIFDGGFGLGSGLAFESRDGQGLRFNLNFGGSPTVLTNDISSLVGTWIHVAAVWDVNGIDGSVDVMRLYVDGAVVASTQTANWGTTVGSQADVAGGNDASIAGQFAVDNLKVFDFAKTDFSDRFQEDGHLVSLAELAIRVSEIELCWDTASNVTYQLQYSSLLTSNMWVPMGTSLIGDGSRFCTNDVVVAEAPQRFYRLVVTNAP